MIKKFKCGLCKPEKRVVMTRHSLRKHLREEHGRLVKLTNLGFTNGKGYIKQDWWIEEK